MQLKPGTVAAYLEKMDAKPAPKLVGGASTPKAFTPGEIALVRRALSVAIAEAKHRLDRSDDFMAAAEMDAMKALYAAL